MKRTELEAKAYEAIKSDMSYIGTTDEEIADKVIEIYEANKTPDFETEGITSPEFVRNNLFVAIRKPVEDGAFTKSFLDLQLTLRVRVNEFATFTVNKDLAEQLELNESIFDEAISKAHFCVSTMGEAIKAIAPDEEIPDCGMYIVSNESKSYGAAAIYDTGLLKNLADKLNSNLVIIPSSIHEIIALKYDSEADIEYLNEMVKEVNYTSVEETEQLSDHVYIFMKDSKVLSF